jgi:GNAT superfamily N-acetyltransferase
MSNLSPVQFKGYDLIVNKGDESHLIEAYKGKYGPVAHFEWSADTGEIKDVKVEPEHQRKGLATAMFNKAKTITPVRHSNVRTPEGDAWAKSVGGNRPENWLSACTACGDEGHLASDHT